MLRRIFPLLAATMVLSALACTPRTESKKDAAESNEQAAETHEPTRNDEDTNDRTTPRALKSKEVRAVEGVQTKTTLEEGPQLRASWSACALESALVEIEGQSRSPLQRLLVHDNHLYAFAEYEGNESYVRAFTIEHNDETCRLTPWNDFGTQGQLDLGVGVADFSVVGNYLVSTGIETTLYSTQGEKLTACSAFPRMTRVRGRQGHPNAVFRKGGEEILHATIQDKDCILDKTYTIEGEEILGMRLVPIDASSAFATLHADRVPNALTYIKDGKVVWRYFPGDENAKERIALITELAPLGKDLAVVRGLQKTIDVINKEGARKLKLDLNEREDFDRKAFPDHIVALTNNQLLLAVRHHISANELEKFTIELLTLQDEDAP